jgi:hypothetical protein
MSVIVIKQNVNIRTPIINAYGPLKWHKFISCTVVVLRHFINVRVQPYPSVHTPTRTNTRNINEEQTIIDYISTTQIS